VNSARPARFDPAWPELALDPYPMYDDYRANDPVHWGIAANPRLRGSWYLFRYEDCVAALADPRLKSDPASVGMADAYPPAFQPVAHVFQAWLGALDAPDHTRIRSVMAKAFTPRRVRALAPRIRVLAEDLLAGALRGEGPFDLVADYSFPLPMAVIGDLLGVPEADREQFRDLSVQFAEALSNPGSSEAAEAGGAATRFMLKYFEGLLAARRAAPGDDLISAMMLAANDDGQVMTELEVLAEAIEMIVAGHETTVNTVAKAAHGLLASGRWASVAVDPPDLTGPAQSSALEELLRWVSPAQRERNRWVSEPMEIGGRELAVGDAVVVMIGAANHDPDRFPRPHELVLDRPPARHLTFGYGPHTCLGATLARMEVGTAMDVLLAGAPGLRLAGELTDVRWRNNTMIPGPAELVVRAQPSPTSSSARFSS
jgi:cytochrome P450